MWKINKTPTPFKRLPAGVEFAYHGKKHLRVTSSKTGAAWNAVEIETGELVMLQADDKVFPTVEDTFSRVKDLIVGDFFTYDGNLHRVGKSEDGDLSCPCVVVLSKTAETGAIHKFGMEGKVRKVTSITIEAE